MKFSILGSCSGTEPFENRHHTAFALTLGERIYWFDAGETCSYTAHLMGLDLLSVSDIFISHPHMDHVGGLGNLFWNIRKLSKVKKQQPRYGDLHLYIPCMETWEGVHAILKNSEGGYRNDYQTLAHPVFDGVLLDNGEIRVTAMHNLHLKEPSDGVWRSFSFLIEAEGKRIVYSGDIKELSELSPWLAEGCDLLLMETGHHHPDQVCQHLIDEGYRVGMLGFLHHGRDILLHHDEMLEKCKAMMPNVRIFDDKDTLELI